MKNNSASWVAVPGRWWIPVLLVVVASARFIHLDADPGFIKSALNNASDVSDEAYWSFAARNLILYGELISDDFFQAATSPFYTVIAYIYYWLFGVSTYVTRLPNAVFGVLAVLIVYRLFSDHNRLAALVAALALALENNLFIHSRMGQVELTCGFFVLLSFYFLLQAKKPFWGGVAFGLAISSKIVALLLGPTFALFFLLQWIRRETRLKDVASFCAGLALIGVFFGWFVLSYYDLFMKNFFLVQSQGNAFLRNPARTLIDFVTGYYLSYPSILLLLVLLGVYVWRTNLVSLFGEGMIKRLCLLTGVEIMVFCWLVGLTVSMIFLSDMHHRRMNLFTIPLAMVPGLLLLRGEEEPRTTDPTTLQVWMLLAPVFVLGTFIGRKMLQLLASYSTGQGMALSGLVMILVTWALVTLCRRKPSIYRELAGWISLVAWVGIVSQSLAYSLPVRILPNLGLVAFQTKALWVAGFLGATGVFMILAIKNVKASLVVFLLLNLVLNAHDLTASTFTARDASFRLREMTANNDYVVGDGAHALSLNALYHPVQAYPKLGVNKEFTARVRPRFLFRETNHRDRNAQIDESGISISEKDLYGVGASMIEPIANFELFPLPGMPAEVTYTLYEVTY